MVNRAQIVKELVPGLHAIFGFDYKQYANEHAVLFDSASSNRAYEEEVLFSGFGGAVVKGEGAPVTYKEASEGWVSRYNHETVALAFRLTEEAMEDNLYESLAKRLARALARAMAHTKQVKSASVFNNAFDSTYTGGDGLELCSTVHTRQDGSTWSNELNPAADLSETALEDMLVQISEWTDEYQIPAALMSKSLHIPPELVFTAERLLKSAYRPGTPDNDVNAIYNMGMFPKGYHVNHRFTDPKAFFIRTDETDGLKHFTRMKIKNSAEGDFETGNMRYKSRERYSFGWSNPRAVIGSAGT